MLTTIKLSAFLVITVCQIIQGWVEAPLGHSQLSYVEVFQPSTERVVTRFPCSADVRHEVSLWFKAITSLSGRLKIEPPKDGLVVHVPLKPPLPLSYSGEQFSIRDVYLMISGDTESAASLLVFTSHGKVLHFHFQHDLEPFLKQHDLLIYLKEFR